MSELRGGQLLARALKAQGVGQVFTLSGAQIHTLYQGCLEEGIQLIDARHEQAAVHMAEGWARATGQTGVALLTAGPGVTNGVTGVANAWGSGSPLVLLGGHSPLSQWGKGAFQEMDQRGILGPITKASQTLYHGKRIPELVAAAFRH
ncbi:MAG: thiamine pyrophosphate-binding protein, partial [Chloroflexota bacterium]